MHGSTFTYSMSFWVATVRNVRGPVRFMRRSLRVVATTKNSNQLRYTVCRIKCIRNVCGKETLGLVVV